LVQELRQTVTSWLTQTVRIRAGEPYAEFEYSVGDIPINDGWGKEVISRFTSTIRTAGKFYTDSNGREMQERTRDFRPTWKLNVTQPIAGNYYPVNAVAYIKDAASQLTVLNDRAQGGASILDGSLEIMIHRRTLADDSRGVGEPMNETESIKPYPLPVRIGKGIVVVGKHYVLVDKPQTAARTWRPLAHRVFAENVLVFSPATQENEEKMYPALKWAQIGNGALPDNVELITLQVLKNPANSVLVRIAHNFAVNEDPILSRPANVSLQALFPNKIATVSELSLTANQKRSEMPPLPAWHIKGEKAPNGPTMRSLAPAVGDDFNVIINPMELRTYQVSF